MDKKIQDFIIGKVENGFVIKRGIGFDCYQGSTLYIAKDKEELQSLLIKLFE